MTEAEREEYLQRQKIPSNLGRIDHRPTLFLTLDQNLRSWRTLAATATTENQQERESFEAALTRLVYNNFDAILTELDSGDPEFRITAAAALGFSKIPAPDEPGGNPDFPPIHGRALDPLRKALDEGDDRLTRNALLALALISTPDSGVDPQIFLEMIVGHHDEDIRANAAMALSKILTPANTTAALPVLYAALDDSSAKVRLHAVNGLIALNEKSSLGRLLLSYDTDSSPHVQANAARALGLLGDRKAIPALIRGLTSKYSIIRVSTYLSLRRIVGEDLGHKPEPWQKWVDKNLKS